MQLQRERRRDPYPWTWELPAAGALTLSLALLLGVQLGRTTANLIAGAGWTWPQDTTTTGVVAATTAGGAEAPAPPSPIDGSFWSTIPAVLTGDSSAGLPTSQRTGAATGDLAGPVLLWTSTAIVELLFLGVLIGSLAAGYQRWGPGRMRGMATRKQAESLLGTRRLRKVAPIVRPDLHGTPARHAQQVQRTASPETTPALPADPTEHRSTR